MRYPVYHYQTPEGYSDFPFTYIFDASGLADGVNVFQVSKALQGDSDFILRQIMGLQTVVDTPANGGRVQLYNASGTFMSNTPLVAAPSVCIVPEKLYQFKDVIKFDLYQTLRSTTFCNIGPNVFTSFIGFRGVKRFTGSGFDIKTTYPYREVPQVYPITITVNWTYYVSPPGTSAVQAPRRFIIPINNWDFELDRILIGGPGAQQLGTAAPISVDYFAISLFDSQHHLTSDLPVPVTMLSSAGGPPGARSRYQAVFPVPPLLYPAGSQITFDITSFLCSNTPAFSWQFAFQGMWRIPCEAGNLPQGEEAV